MPRPTRSPSRISPFCILPSRPKLSYDMSVPLPPCCVPHPHCGMVLDAWGRSCPPHRIVVVGVVVVASALFVDIGRSWAAVAVLAVLGTLLSSSPPSSRLRCIATRRGLFSGPGYESVRCVVVVVVEPSMSQRRVGELQPCGRRQGRKA